MTLVLFFFSIITILYVYIGFPILLTITGSLRKQRVLKKPITPSVSLIIAAYNEERSIAQKIENILALNYPRSNLEIIIASDGSNDQTDAIISSISSSQVKLLSLPRRGKIYALSDAVRQSKGSILVFSDANTLFHPDALQKLVMNFADPKVGGVCGNQIYLSSTSKDSINNGEKFYWSYDKWLKEVESLTGNIVSADGAIYAVRRDLFQVPGSASVTDDFAISTAVIEQGYRLVFEKEALAYEKLTAGAKQEFSRKVRIMNRGLRAVLLRKALLNPCKYGFYSIVLFSHKILRRLVPFFLILLFFTNMSLINEGTIYQMLAIMQLVFYSWAALGYLLRKTMWGKSKIIYIPTFYCLANIAAAIAIFKLFTGQTIELWQPQR